MLESDSEHHVQEQPKNTKISTHITSLLVDNYYLQYIDVFLIINKYLMDT